MDKVKYRPPAYRRGAYFLMEWLLTNRVHVVYFICLGGMNNYDGKNQYKFYDGGE